MLDRRVSVSLLIVWLGIALGLGLLILSDILETAAFNWWGIAVLGLACTHSLHRGLSVREDRLRDAFTLGRDHERGQVERTPRSVR